MRWLPLPLSDWVRIQGVDNLWTCGFLARCRHNRDSSEYRRAVLVFESRPTVDRICFGTYLIQLRKMRDMHRWCVGIFSYCCLPVWACVNEKISRTRIYDALLSYSMIVMASMISGCLQLLHNMKVGITSMLIVFVIVVQRQGRICSSEMIADGWSKLLPLHWPVSGMLPVALTFFATKALWVRGCHVICHPSPPPTVGWDYVCPKSEGFVVLIASLRLLMIGQ